MTTTTKWIIAFWVFIIGMLVWQFYDYNKGLDQAAIEHPQQTHFYFIHSNNAPVAPPPVQMNGPDVQQVGYTVQNNVPSSGNFTVNVTLKNMGNTKAVGVQIHIRPYRGMRLGDEDAGNSNLRILSDDDPLSQYGAWVSFPDLAPGESSTQSVIFLSHEGATPVVPGSSDMGIPGQPMEKIKPEIVFSAEQPAPKAPLPPGAGG
jgi:hypothetical protein